MKDEEIKSSALGQSKERADLRLECDRLRVEADKYKSDYTNLKAKVYQLEDSVESEIKAKLFGITITISILIIINIIAIIIIIRGESET